MSIAPRRRLGRPWQFVVLLLLLLLVQEWRDRAAQPGGNPDPTGSSATSTTTVEQLAREDRSGVMVRAEGSVQRTLADDNEGSRHQRFILELASGHTVLVAHNIDLAPRVPLARGDRVTVYGQFEDNERGGVLHWTHHDPGGRRAGGWIEHEGERYR